MPDINPTPTPTAPPALASLPPVVPGTAYARRLQALNADGSTPSAEAPEPFLASDVLTCSIGPSGGGPAIATAACVWVNPPLAEFAFSLTGQQTAALSAAGSPYLVEVTATRGTATWTIHLSYLPVLPAVGTV